MDLHRPLLTILSDLRDDLDGRYDGAPDSTTLWMGEPLEALNRIVDAVVADDDMGNWNYGGLRSIGTSPGIDVGADDGRNICLVHPAEGGDRETFRVARLIAAAPETTRALSQLLDAVRDYINDPEGCAGALTSAMLRAEAAELRAYLRPVNKSAATAHR